MTHNTITNKGTRDYPKKAKPLRWWKCQIRVSVKFPAFQKSVWKGISWCLVKWATHHAQHPYPFPPPPSENRPLHTKQISQYERTPCRLLYSSPFPHIHTVHISFLKKGGGEHRTRFWVDKVDLESFSSLGWAVFTTFAVYIYLFQKQEFLEIQVEFKSIAWH